MSEERTPTMQVGKPGPTRSAARLIVVSGDPAYGEIKLEVSAQATVKLPPGAGPETIETWMASAEVKAIGLPAMADLIRYLAGPVECRCGAKLACTRTIADQYIEAFKANKGGPLIQTASAEDLKAIEAAEKATFRG